MSKQTDIRESERPAGFAPANGYAAWRAAADEAHAEMMVRYWKLKREMDCLSEEINDLARVMGNGVSGGTAWTLHPLHTNAIYKSHEIEPQKKL